LNFDVRPTTRCAIEKNFARRGRCPNILGAKQSQERDVAIPAGLPPIVTRCRIERHGRPAVALRQLSRPRARRGADRE
jgi:hypothetical protein